MCIAPDSVEHVFAPLTLIRTGHYGIPLNGELHPSRYLPWYPLIFLAPFQRISELNGAIIGVWMGNLLCVLALFTAVLMVTRKKSFAVLALFSLIFSDRLLYLSGVAMTEFPYIGFSCILLLLAARFYSKNNMPSIWEIELCGIAGAAAGAMRSSGYILLAIPWIILMMRSKTWKDRFLFSLLLAVWPLAILSMTVYFNWSIFGTPFRSGYHYWCPVPYEIPGLTFNLRYIRPNIAKMVAEGWFYCASIQLLLAAVWGVLRWLRKIPANPLIDSATVFAVFHLAVLFGLYTAYFFYEERFFLPGVITAIPASFAIIAAFTRKTCGTCISNIKNHAPSFLPYALCIVSLFLFVSALAHAKHRIPMPSSGNCALEEKMLAAIDRTIPDDAVFLSPFLPVRTDFFLNLGKHRLIIPYARSTEYASKIISLEPLDLANIYPIPDNPFDHLNPALLSANGCRLAVPLTADDEGDVLQGLLQSGRRIFLVVSPTVPGPPFSISQDITLTPVLADPQFTILEVKTRTDS